MRDSRSPCRDGDAVERSERIDCRRDDSDRFARLVHVAGDGDYATLLATETASSDVQACRVPRCDGDASAVRERTSRGCQADAAAATDDEIGASRSGLVLDDKE